MNHGSSESCLQIRMVLLFKNLSTLIQVCLLKTNMG